MLLGARKHTLFRGHAGFAAASEFTLIFGGVPPPQDSPLSWSMSNGFSLAHLSALSGRPFRGPLSCSPGFGEASGSTDGSNEKRPAHGIRSRHTGSSSHTLLPLFLHELLEVAVRPELPLKIGSSACHVEHKHPIRGLLVA